MLRQGEGACSKAPCLAVCYTAELCIPASSHLYDPYHRIADPLLFFVYAIPNHAAACTLHGTLQRCSLRLPSISLASSPCLRLCLAFPLCLRPRPPCCLCRCCRPLLCLLLVAGMVLDHEALCMCGMYRCDTQAKRFQKRAEGASGSGPSTVQSGLFIDERERRGWLPDARGS